jgi:hypothetical protein
MSPVGFDPRTPRIVNLRSINWQSSKWELEFTGPNQILEFISINIHLYLNKNWKMYWSEQNVTGLGTEDRFSSWWLTELRETVMVMDLSGSMITKCRGFFSWFLVFSATFSNILAISWWPVLVVEEAGENHRPWASNW